MRSAPVKGKAEKTRRQLLDAAVQVIARKGYGAATVDEIVSAAGVSKGVAYYHFKSKASMATSILEEGIGSLIARFEEIARTAQDAPHALRDILGCFSTMIYENKEFGRFFVAELWREGRVWSDVMRSYEDRLLAILRTLIARGQEDGTFREEVDPSFEAIALIGLVLTTSMYCISETGDDEVVGKDAFIERICDLVAHATMVPPRLG